MFILFIEMALPFDRRKLENYLAEKLKVEVKSGTGAIQQFSVGQSNPTYLIDTIGGTKYVLRKKPHGILLDKAHMIEREYRVQSALSKTDFPCPKMYIYCVDKNVIGTEFFIMEYKAGRVFESPQLPGLSPEDRNVAYTSMIDNLAKLHSYDYHALGLGNFGRGDNYVSRQIYIWEKNYNATPKVPKHPEMNQLIAWMKNNIPSEQNHRYTIVHGDYTFINTALTNQNPPFVSAVFDWELSTIGLPLTDLALFVITFINLNPSSSDTNEPQFLLEKIDALGVPHEKDMLRLYCKLSKIEIPPEHEWTYFKVLALFKIASILQGVYGRAFTGNASSDSAKSFGDLIQPIIKTALSLTGTIGYVQPTVPDFIHLSQKGREMLGRVKSFMTEFVYPNELKIMSEINEPPKWKLIPTLENLKLKAKKEGLWNLFLPGE